MLRKVPSVLKRLLICMLFKLYYEIACVRKAALVGYFRHRHIRSPQKKLGAVYSVIRKIIVWRRSHNAFKNAYKMKFGNRNIRYDLIHCNYLRIFLMYQVYYALHIFGVVPAAFSLLGFNTIRNESTEHIVQS